MGKAVGAAAGVIKAAIKDGKAAGAAEDVIKESLGPVWSSTTSKTPVENAYGHWSKHGSEFPEYQNALQYAEGAKDFVSHPPSGALVKTRPNGDTVLYDPATNTFAVKDADGAPKTMFRPDPAQHGYPTNLDYFNAQK